MASAECFWPTKPTRARWIQPIHHNAPAQPIKNKTGLSWAFQAGHFFFWVEAHVSWIPKHTSYEPTVFQDNLKNLFLKNKFQIYIYQGKKLFSFLFLLKNLYFKEAVYTSNQPLCQKLDRTCHAKPPQLVTLYFKHTWSTPRAPCMKERPRLKCTLRAVKSLGLDFELQKALLSKVGLFNT